MGEVQVPETKFWGAQTQRSIDNFPIGNERIPTDIIDALAIIKRSAAIVNHKLGLLNEKVSGSIIDAADRILCGNSYDQFPLSVWQTGSGTHTNMNMNEVLSYLAGKILQESGRFNVDTVIHPNDHVNLSQSSNDTFPSAIHIAAVIYSEKHLIPALRSLKSEFEILSERFKDIIKIGRTHLQDATPLTLGQEVSGYSATLRSCEMQIDRSLEYLRELAQGGTAVGTGINAPPDFAKMIAEEISLYTRSRFVAASNFFQALSSHDAICYYHGALKTLAASLMKIANDIRWLASGPRAGIGELKIPENEPGSSIMPGKVNPSQAEALTMVAVQIMGNDTAITIASSQGNFELNVYKPLIGYNLMQSIRLLTDAMNSFRIRCVVGIEPRRDVIDENLRNSLMLVTALAPYIGYNNAARVAKLAHDGGLTLKRAALELGFLSEEELDRILDPKKMI